MSLKYQSLILTVKFSLRKSCIEKITSTLKKLESFQKFKFVAKSKKNELMFL